MSIELKIKSKHLALEPAIIRCEERKLKKQIKWMIAHYNPEKPVAPLEQKLQSLINHRRIDVGNEQRATFLARAYIAGKPYSSVECNVRCKYTLHTLILPRIVAMVKKYGDFNTSPSDIIAWLTRAA